MFNLPLGSETDRRTELEREKDIPTGQKSERHKDREEDTEIKRERERDRPRERGGVGGERETDQNPKLKCSLIRR